MCERKVSFKEMKELLDINLQKNGKHSLPPKGVIDFPIEASEKKYRTLETFGLKHQTAAEGNLLRIYT